MAFAPATEAGAGAGGLLTVDLDALADNWRRLRDRLGPGTECGGVVKANGYGLGAAAVARTLVAAGCRTLFVAQLEEGLALAPALPPGVRVFVLSGPPPGTEPAFTAAGLIPVLNSPQQIAGWAAHVRTLPETDAAGRALRARAAAALHVDTGMERLGLSRREVDAVAADPTALSDSPLALVMSHLGCADVPGHPLNTAQARAFVAARARFPGVPGSLANSSGIFLGTDWHHDVARPGVALYGVNPTPGRPNPMAPVVRLQARILQVRRVDAPATVGYGAGHRAAAGTRIATVGVGYADGLLRACSDGLVGGLGETPVPLIGRVSMDLATFDISAVPEDRPVQPGDVIDLIGPLTSLDDVAARAGTIGYEILTSLGSRYARRYVGGPDLTDGHATAAR